MIIAQISDTHLDMDAPDYQRRIDDFGRTVADIVKLPRQPDLIIHTGDVTHNGRPAEYEVAKEILKKANLPYFAIPGNRDDRANFIQAFADKSYANRHCEFVQYQVEGYPAAIFMLDTVCVSNNRGEYCDVRRQHLAELNDRNDGKPVLIFSHHPPFDANDCPEPFQFTSQETRNCLIDAINQVSRLKALICGHVHRFDLGTVCNQPAFAMPSTATSLRWGNYPSFRKNNPVYQIIELNEDEVLSVQTRLVGKK